VVTALLGVFGALTYAYERDERQDDLNNALTVSADQLATGLALVALVRIGQGSEHTEQSRHHGRQCKAEHCGKGDMSRKSTHGDRM